jgi:hypothetical protein
MDVYPEKCPVKMHTSREKVHKRRGRRRKETRREGITSVFSI